MIIWAGCAAARGDFMSLVLKKVLKNGKGKQGGRRWQNNNLRRLSDDIFPDRHNWQEGTKEW
jgi:hypothetical protein